MASQSPSRLLAGEVGKPHGLSGEVYVVPISDDPGRFDPGSTLLRESGDALIVASSRTHGNRLLVRFEGIADRESAEALRGALYIRPEEARKLEANEYWPHDLVGCVVADANGDVGRVVAVDPGAAQDLLRIETPNGERLIPLVGDIVVSIDTAGRRIVIDPPEGLLD
jgi:16S rRNA processing protein RimM